MKHFLIATNSIKDENLLLTSKIEEYISMHGGSSRRIIGELEGEVAYKVDDMETFDCVIALGGDGTILNVSRDLRKMNLPIVGVNLGTLGFLTEVEPEQIYPVLDRLMRDDYEIEERMNIMGTVYKENDKNPPKIILRWIYFTHYVVGSNPMRLRLFAHALDPDCLRNGTAVQDDDLHLHSQ